MSIKAIAAMEGKSVTELFQEIMAQKIEQYPNIAQRVSKRPVAKEE